MFNYQGSQNQISYTYTTLISGKKQRKMYPPYKKMIINILDKSMGSCKMVLSAPSFESTYSPFAFTSWICFNSKKSKLPACLEIWMITLFRFTERWNKYDRTTGQIYKHWNSIHNFWTKWRFRLLQFYLMVHFLYISYFVFRLLHSLLSTRRNNVAAFGRLLILYNTALDFQMNFTEKQQHQ